MPLGLGPPRARSNDLNVFWRRKHEIASVPAFYTNYVNITTKASDWVGSPSRPSVRPSTMQTLMRSPNVRSSFLAHMVSLCDHTAVRPSSSTPLQTWSHMNLVT